jgi:protoheme IX farnesyltransferase
LFQGTVDRQSAWGVFIGVTALAAGASALNQAIEHQWDRLMIRTGNRPIPSGVISAVHASWIGIGVTLLGAGILMRSGGIIPMAIGIAATVCYLAVYTPLKRRTPCALLFGALCGAMPPVIGWCSAGGALTDYRIVLYAGVFYLWQMPHFWVLQKRHESDYIHAGFPVVTHTAKNPNLVTLWTIAVVSATLLLPAFATLPPRSALVLALLSLPLGVLAFLKKETSLFSYIRIFPLLLSTAPLVS